MPNIEKLVKRADYLVDDRIDPNDAIGLINDCLEDLSEIAKYEKKAQGTVDQSGLIPVPGDFIKSIKLSVNYNTVINLPINNGEAEEFLRESVYTLYEDQIEVFPKPQTEKPYDLYYYADLPEIKDTDDQGNAIDYMQQEPPLPSRYARMISLYLAFRYFENWEGGNGQRDNYRNQYEVLKLQFASMMQKKESRNRNRKVIISRGWY